LISVHAPRYNHDERSKLTYGATPEPLFSVYAPVFNHCERSPKYITFRLSRARRDLKAAAGAAAGLAATRLACCHDPTRHIPNIIPSIRRSHGRARRAASALAVGERPCAGAGGRCTGIPAVRSDYHRRATELFGLAGRGS